MALRIELKGRSEPIWVDCDKHEEKQVAVGGGWPAPFLVLYNGEREIGKYKMSDVIGYHEEDKPSFSVA